MGWDLWDLWDLCASMDSHFWNLYYTAMGPNFVWFTFHTYKLFCLLWQTCQVDDQLDMVPVTMILLAFTGILYSIPNLGWQIKSATWIGVWIAIGGYRWLHLLWCAWRRDAKKQMALTFNDNEGCHMEETPLAGHHEKVDVAQEDIIGQHKVI